MGAQILSTAVPLMLVIDPVGNVPLVVSKLAGVPAEPESLDVPSFLRDE